MFRHFAMLLAATAVSASAGAQQVEPPRAATSVQLTAQQLFALADAARDAGDFAAAETAYRALAGNPDVELRTEARFRLGLMLADRMQKYREAAVEFRRILDEKPGAARVRLELARMNAMLGNMGAAERELRAAQAAGLPPEVERAVRFYAGALAAMKPVGGSLEISLAPDSNINRATKSDSLGTVIGDFTLDRDARARSGLGLDLRGQAYARIGVQPRTTLLLRASGSADIYRDATFDDFILSLQAGPEYALGKGKLALSIGPSWRWYGTDPYSFTLGGGVDWRQSVGKRAQLQVSLGIADVDNRRNDLQDGMVWSASVEVDRALTARAGGGIQFSAARATARDPGYATAQGGISLFAFREFGRTTGVLSLGYTHLEADKRLALFPKRRVDDRFTAAASVTWRALQVRGFAPFTRLRWERNRSTVGIYDYRRVAAEAGITSAF